MAGDIIEGLNSVPFKWPGDPQSIIINGVGRFNSSIAPQYAEFEGASGQTMLLRIVNSGMLSYLNMFIEGHNMTVIEADGHYVEPFEVSNIDVNIGERYSVLIHMDQPVGIYPIHAAIKYRNERVGQAMLVYSGAMTTDDTPEIEELLDVSSVQRMQSSGAPVADIMDPTMVKGIEKLPSDMASYDEELVLEGRQVGLEITRTPDTHGWIIGLVL